MRVLDCVTWLAISDLALQMAIVEFVMFCLVFGLVVQYIEYIETWLRICSNPDLSCVMIYLIFMSHFGLNLWRLIENLIDVV